MEDFNIRDLSEEDSGEIFSEKEQEFEKKLRPLDFDDFKGQFKVVDNLKIFVQAAKMRNESLDHVLAQPRAVLW